ncbi:glycosyltransferase family 2 protein [uncultured Sphingomonas sp.]|uniref:glycosyltransferase family 2 protein n=1 Tax=uncultured Sphingomonas sp. TaxID=158754 RepID=UPI0035CBA850
MYLDLDPLVSSGPPRIEQQVATRWTVLIPFFNERDYLAATIASLAAQTVTPTMILVDNGSTDGSADVARDACREHGADFVLVTERVPGKIAALATGLAWVRTLFVATCDADTLYPPDYLAQAQRLLERPGCAVAGAYFVRPGATRRDRIAKARAILLGASLLPRQCHTGGAGQAFRTATLRAAGGFDALRWGFVLEDHEVIHRVMASGSMRYSADLWCMPSPRERDRDSIRWTLVERLLYSVAAPWAGDWFFYTFLARRLKQRRLHSNRMRERRFYSLEGPVLASSHPVL